MLNRMVAYGYRIGEVPLPVIGDIKTECSFSLIADVDTEKRYPIAVSLGCHIKDYAQPEPDPNDPYTMAAGVCKRFACAPPKPDSKRLTRLKEFVSKFVRENFKPIPREADISVSTWLESTNYPLWRKRELEEAWSKVGDSSVLKEKKYLRCKSFMKDETYAEYKHARGINSRHDAFKCFVGPVFKLMENIVYSHPSFIKHVPVADRPDYIMKLLYTEGAKYFATDYTAFESLFTKELLEACEFVLYEWLTKDLPIHDDFMKALNVIAGKNVCMYKYFTVELEATRMSGEMNTSLGNGFSNLMFMLFLCAEAGSNFMDGQINGVVEGDDGLFSITGPTPTMKDFESLGLRIKLEVHTDISKASFCGIIFHPHDRINIADPRKVLTTFGWACGKYRNARSWKLVALLRCKALSLAYQYPGCPIIQSLAEYGLRVTAWVPTCRLLRVANEKGVFDSYHRERVLESLSSNLVHREVGLASRLLMEELYGMSVESQIQFETYLKHLTKLQPLDPMQFTQIFPQVYHDYAQRYIMKVPVDVGRPQLPARSKYVVDEIEALMGRNVRRRWITRLDRI